MKVSVFMIIVGIIFLCIFVGLLTLIVRALLKYIHSKDVRQEKSVVRKSLGEALKAHRTQCKMTQEFVAETIGVSRQAVSKWENGTSDPSTSNLFALAKLYGVSVEELLKEVGSLLGLFLQSFLIKFTMLALNIFIFVIVYGRMIEIYLLTSLAPIPVATLSNRELGAMGQNYLRSLFAVGFQGMLILVCVAIYAVLIQGIATGGDPIGAIWGCIGYTVLLCFMLMKTGTISKSIFSAH